ncbi:MAG: sodium:proton antiporter [Sphingomicrobium sp.]
MRRGRWLILVLSTVGVLISTAIIGGGFFWLSRGLGVDIPIMWCFVFGSLISPTDPVAVMGVLKRTQCPPMLRATVAGESLFNDGVGVVVFSILVAAALGGNDISVPHAGFEFLVEAGGGVLLGLGTGWLGFIAMRSIDEYNVELMISLAIVMGGYALGHWLGVSGPVAMAVAGLLIGNAGVAQAMSETTRDHVLKFWALVDELLNAVLFLLIGLEIMTISPSPVLLLLGALAIPLLLVARTLSVALPLQAMRTLAGWPALATLVWGGLRGGISVALALSLPDVTARAAVLTVTYVAVLFSVLIQGGSIARVVKRVGGPC